MLMCSGCGATIEADEVTQGGHVIPGSIPDLCGPVDEANPAVCRHCSASYWVPKKLVPQEFANGSTIEVFAVSEDVQGEAVEGRFTIESAYLALRWPIVHRCAGGSPIESSHAG